MLNFVFVAMHYDDFFKKSFRRLNLAEILKLNLGGCRRRGTNRLIHGTASVHMARPEFLWHGIYLYGTASICMARHKFIWHGISLYGTA